MRSTQKSHTVAGRGTKLCSHFEKQVGSFFKTPHNPAILCKYLCSHNSSCLNVYGSCVHYYPKMEIIIQMSLSCKKNKLWYILTIKHFNHKKITKLTSINLKWIVSQSHSFHFHVLTRQNIRDKNITNSQWLGAKGKAWPPKEAWMKSGVDMTQLE